MIGVLTDRQLPTKVKTKSTSSLMLPQAFVVCFGALLACATASVLTYNESSTTNPWVLPAGPNLLATATPAPTSSTVVYGSSPSWATLTDGSIGTPTPNSTTPNTTQMNTVVMPNAGATVTFTLDTSGAHSAGYDITALDSYGLWNDSGRDDQSYTIAYSTVATPATFTPLATVYNHTVGAAKSTHSRVVDSTGILALHVAAIQITFGAQENGNAGYSEFVLTDTLPVVTANESNTTNVWTLPAGSNLLHDASPSSPPPASAHGVTTSSSWSTLTNGQLGPLSGDLLACVGPNNEQSVVFPLDLAVNTKGYDLSSLDFYGAWQDSGRDNLDFSVSYSTWDNPTQFQLLTNVGNHTGNPQDATHTRLTPLRYHQERIGHSGVHQQFNRRNQLQWFHHRERGHAETDILGRQLGFWIRRHGRCWSHPGVGRNLQLRPHDLRRREGHENRQRHRGFDQHQHLHRRHHRHRGHARGERQLHRPH